jgi:hypothetical protein
MTAKKFASAVLLLACAATGLSAAPAAADRPAIPARAAAGTPANTPVTGDYVEARTASVFAGACHYSGEFVTIGRDALLAWNVAAGRYNGVDLAGLKAAAAVTSDKSLGDTAPRKTELAVDPAATPAQVAAFTALLQATSGKDLGTITATRRTPISFTHTADGYTVAAEKFGTLVVHPMADAACCIQPNLVWYTPLTPLDARKVGYTEQAACTPAIADQWTRTGEDGAFYGAFTLDTAKPTAVASAQ